MKIIEVRSLPLPDVKVIRFERTRDNRGSFTETFRKSIFLEHPHLAGALKGVEFVQLNESMSRPNAIRGLHFQWNPLMGKLVRTVSGRMIDLALDIRKGSPTFGKIVAHDMPANRSSGCGEWIWVPPGFAHGNFFTEESLVEYLCSGGYNSDCEAGISPLSDDLDWSLCDRELKRLYDSVIAGPALLIKEKDRNAPSLRAWSQDVRSDNFIFGEL